jgi:Ca2+/Na+ antiporter
MKHIIRNRVKHILDEQIAGNYTLFYSSMLHQLVVLYIAIIAIAFLLLAHLSIWPVLVLTVYILIAYLFGAYRNNSIAINADAIMIINARKPFMYQKKIEIHTIEQIIIGTNQHPILDRLFIIPSNLYIQILLKNKSQKTFYTNVDFASDTKPDDKSIEDLVGALQALHIPVLLQAKRDDDEL